MLSTCYGQLKKKTIMQEINFRLIATQIGDKLKYATSVNEIDRYGQSILRISKENFPNNWRVG